jgi:hippurate hydrolase
VPFSILHFSFFIFQSLPMRRFLLPALLAATPLFGADVAPLVDKELPSLIKLYEELHANPELSLHEDETAARVAKELRGAGLEVTENVGALGVVGVLKNGPGPVILVRTDLDALPVKEQTGLPYASTKTTKDDLGREVSVMHACGHDVHMACFVGTARLLSQLRSEWSGTVVMIGQPAEERILGARIMLRGGL